MNVGFVGLGAMGLPITRNLLKAGHRVTVASRSRGPIDAALAAGAVDGGGAAGVAGASEITIMCVPSSPDVQQVVNAMLGALGPGKIVVDCSTIDPLVEVDLHVTVAETGASYLEAPVSGGTTGAERGTLTLMVGGEPGVLERARPALEAFSDLIVHIGGPGTGQVVKLCNNLIFAAQMVATAEAFTLAHKNGVDLGKLHEVLVRSTGDCTAVRTRVPFEGVVPDSPASTGWRPGFASDLMAKDLELALAAGARAGTPMLSTALARQLLAAAAAAGFGREDFSAVGKVIRTLARSE